MALIVEINEKIDSPFEKVPQLIGIYHWNEGKRLMHLHEDRAEINFILSGFGTHVVGSEVCHTQPGDVLIYDSFVLHDESVMLDSQVVAWCIALTNFKIFNQRENSFLPDSIRPILPAQFIADDLTQLYMMIYKYVHTPNGYLIANSAAQTISLLVYDLIQKNKTVSNSKDNFIVQKLQNFINEHYTENISINDLADLVNASESYITHVFKKMLNYSPMQYVMRRRIGKAQSLLIYTNLSLTEISARVGYDDSNYFSRIFKKVIGIPPNLYRKRWIENSTGSAPSDI